MKSVAMLAMMLIALTNIGTLMNVFAAGNGLGVQIERRCAMKCGCSAPSMIAPPPLDK